MKNRFFFIIVIYTLLVGCGAKKLPKDVGPLVIIPVDTDMVLQRDYINTQFRVKDGFTLDLNGHLVNGSRSGGRFICVNLADHASVKNGALTGCALAVGVDNAVPLSLRAPLNGMNEQEGKEYVISLKGMANTNQSVDNIIFSNNTTDVYITRYTSFTRISNSSSSGALKMSVYMDADSTGSTIIDSSFTNCGTSRDKSCVMIDGSSDNILTGNYFYKTKKAIELYKNCGEGNIPRWNGANNNTIKDSSFRDLTVGINISSRKHDRFTSCRADDLGDIVEGTTVINNNYSNVVSSVIDNTK